MQSHLPQTLRIPFVRRCSFAPAGNGDGVAMLLDLSLQGVYVATERLPAVGETLTIRFGVPDNDRELMIQTVVAWLQTEQTHPVHGLPVGFGARFQKVEIEDIRVIARTIQRYCESNPIYRQYL